MKVSKLLALATLSAASMFLIHGSASAGDILCKTVTNNHMLVSDSYVSACIDAGLGNIGQGNQANDDWLKNLPSGHGYSTIGDQTFTQGVSTGTFSIDAAEWANYDDLFVGFKFGTGNEPDEWFIYQLVDNVSSGTWEFVNVFGKGGGLSHVSLYGRDDGGGPGNGNGNGVPEPATLALVGLGLLGAAAARRRRRV